MHTKPYTYNIPAQEAGQFDLNRLDQISPLADPTPLTGFVNGLRASDLEERFARGLHHAGLRFKFQYPVMVAGCLSGAEKHVDFLVEKGFYYPIEIDGLIAHRTTAQKGKDLVREILLNQEFTRRGIHPLQRVKWWRLDTQEMANQTVRDIFGGV